MMAGSTLGLVSVCLPVYNGERFLSAAIESVLAQSYKNLELIISDDCSTDASFRIAGKYAASDPRIRLVRNQTNLGLFGNYNTCLQHCRGEFIKPFAQDDLLFPEFLARTVSALHQNPDVSLVGTERDHIDYAGNRFTPELPKAPWPLRTGSPVSGLELLAESLFPVENFVGEPTCVMFRSEYMGSGFDETFNHLGDLDYWLRIALSARYLHLDQTLCSFRHHDTSSTSRNHAEMLYATDFFALGEKYSSFFEHCGRTRQDFIDCTLDALAQHLTTHGLPLNANGSFAFSDRPCPPGFRDIAAHALAALSRSGVRQSASVVTERRIQHLEKELGRYLNSSSWRSTKPLRELNAQVANWMPGSETSLLNRLEAKGGSLDTFTYVEFLKRQIRLVRRSKSWRITKLLRWLESDTKHPARRQRPQSYAPKKAKHRTSDNSTPLVSIIVPTWNRAKILRRALSSIQTQTYKNWECIVVDDGSTDETAAVLQDFLSDRRFQFIRSEHKGVTLARNTGIQRSQGSIIAYLDSDNIWLAEYLEGIVEAYLAGPETNSIYTAQLVQSPNKHDDFQIRYHEYDRHQLQVNNYIDLNVFSHRRHMIERHGAFDTALDSLVDWDLILRYTRDNSVRSLPIVGSLYFSDAQNRISDTVDHKKSRELIARGSASGGGANLRVLYALWQYPQLTQAYIETEILAVRRLGVHVEVWAEEDVAVPHKTEVRIHRGTIEEALKKVHPHVVHTHWLHIAQRFEKLFPSGNWPMTARAHGYEVTPELVYGLNSSQTIRRVYLHPHQLQDMPAQTTKLEPLVSAFNETLYYPHLEKDRRMVLRVGAGLWHKGYRHFMETALLCPDHRFVMVVGTVYQREEVMEEIAALNESLGNPVEMIRDLQPDEINQIVKRAGIYMYTLAPDEPFGMPISVAEAMATGASLLAYDRPEARGYMGEAGRYYTDARHAAELIKETSHWTDDRWRDAFCRSVARAHERYRSMDVFKKLVQHWTEIVEADKQ